MANEVQLIFIWPYLATSGRSCFLEFKNVLRIIHVGLENAVLFIPEISLELTISPYTGNFLLIT